MGVFTYALLGNRYMSKATTPLLHSFRANNDHQAIGRSLCGRIPASSACDDAATNPLAEPTCKGCRKKDPRFKGGDGPFVLKSMLQF